MGQIFYPYIGSAKAYQKIVPGNTVTAIAETVYSTKIYRVAYTSGGTYVMKVGDTVVGASSAATGIILARTITSGTDAGGTAAGILDLRCAIGTWTSGENLNVESNSNVATITGVPAQDMWRNYGYVLMEARSLLIQCVANTACVCWDGTIPSQASGQTVGIELGSGNSMVLHDTQDIKQFLCIDKTSGSASIIKLVAAF